jgi:taurine dioxygenase
MAAVGFIDLSPAIGVEVRGLDVSRVTPDQAEAHHAMPGELRDRLDGLRTINIAGFKPDSEFEYDTRRFAPSELPESTYHNYRTTYPVLHHHPITGQPLLFVNEFFSSRIEGMEYDESEALYRELFAVLYDPAYLYVHEWRQGDLLVWDNLALQHARRPFAAGQRGTRNLRRVAVNPRSSRSSTSRPRSGIRSGTWRPSAEGGDVALGAHAR